MWSINDPKVKAIHYRIGEMIAPDNQPFFYVQDIGFQRVMKLVAPRYEIHSRRYFSEKIVPSIYDKMKCSISKIFEIINGI